MTLVIPSGLTALPGDLRNPAGGQGIPPPLVLFASGLNTGSSIMAEAILRHAAQGRVHAASAGETAYPDVVHPMALECLCAHQVPTAGLRSKGWGEFFGLSKPPVRFLITFGEVYASKAGWSPNTLIANWNTPDPAALVGQEIDIRSAFEETYRKLHGRIQQFLALDWERMEGQSLVEALADIGER